MRILLFGNRGMLGTDLGREFEKSSHEVIGVDREEIDLTYGPNIADVFQTIKPELVINATGYTDVDGAENNREAALALNDKAVRYLVEGASAVAAKFIHISTEMVSNGQNKAGYTEGAEPEPISVYGASKAAGEKHVMAYSRGYLIRTSWLYGKSPQRGKPRGLNFIDNIIKLSTEKDEIKVVNDQFGKLTSTHDLAEAIVGLISQRYSPGVYHLVNEGVATWYDVAREVWRLKNIKTRLVPTSSNNYPTVAVRPQYGILLNSKYHPLRAWQAALAEYLK